MQTIPTPINGRIQDLPVLSFEHLTAYQQIKDGKIPSCPRHILNDLVSIGWIKEVHHGREN